MKFQIERTSDRKSNPPPCEGAVFEGKSAGFPYNDNIYTINIGTIEELLALMDDLGEPLIVDRRLSGEPCIEIYDDYRE